MGLKCVCVACLLTQRARETSVLVVILNGEAVAVNAAPVRELYYT